MQAALISILKWVITAVIVPIIQKWVAAYFASKQKLKDFKESRKKAIKKGEEYESSPTDDNLNKLP